MKTVEELRDEIVNLDTIAMMERFVENREQQVLIEQAIYTRTGASPDTLLEGMERLLGRGGSELIRKDALAS